MRNKGLLPSEIKESRKLLALFFTVNLAVALAYTGWAFANAEYLKSIFGILFSQFLLQAYDIMTLFFD